MGGLLTRDSAVWILAIIGAVVAYLIGIGKPPTEWNYGEWLQSGAFLIGTLSGYLKTSPLPHSQYGDAKITPKDFR